MHADWNNGSTAADFIYVSADDDHRSYRTQHAPKAKRRPLRPKATAKPSGIYRRSNNRWAW